MVISDGDARAPHQTDTPPAAPVERARLAPPLHRLAAVIVDVFVVLTPIYVLLSAPIKRALTAGVLTGRGPDPGLYTLASLMLALVLGVMYQSLCHHHFGATLGKRLFGLKVVPAFGQSHLGAHLVRSLTWMFTLGLGGVPFLAVFAHAKRRPLHDRVGDTLVISERDGVGQPVAWTQGLVRTAYVMSSLTMLISAGVATRDLFSRTKDIDPAGECEVVTRYSAEDDGADEHARVHLALTLYAAGLADRQCLEAEVEREVSVQTPVAAVTYLAQAFVNADDAEVSNAYLDQVCSEASTSSECAMSRVVGQWSDEKWDEVGQTLKAAPAGSGYLEVWGVRHFLKQARYAQALAQLDQLMDRPEVADFTLDQRVRALYGAYRTGEAREAYKQAMVTLEPTVARELSAWSCVQEFESGCGAVAQTSCTKAGANKSSLDDTGAVRLARLRVAECSKDVGVDYLELADDTEDDQWRQFYQGSHKVQRSDRGAAVALFTRVIESEDSSDLLRVEATRRLAMIATPRQMKSLITRWNEFDSPAAWARAGNVLIDRLALRGEGQLALSVAQTLSERQALSPRSEQRLTTLDPNSTNVRAPASVAR